MKINKLNKDMLELIEKIRLKYNIEQKIELVYTNRKVQVGLTAYVPKSKNITIGISRKSLLKYGEQEAFKLLRHELAHAICMAKNLDAGHNSIHFKQFCIELNADARSCIGKKV